MERNVGIVDLFPDCNTVKLPDMRQYQGMMKNVKTAICGKKNWERCEMGNIDCPEYCIKQDTDMKHLKLHDIGDILI